jgi:hypothetical protein
VARQHLTLAAIAAVAGLMLSYCAQHGRDAEFDHPPDSTYVVITGQLQHGDILAEVQAAEVTTEFFAAVNRPPWLGRTFFAREFEVHADPVVIVSHKLWESRLGGRPEIIGRALQLDGRERTVIGVMPPAIEWPPGVDLWIPQISQAR